MSELQSIQRDVAEIRDAVRRMERSLNGNGEPGIKTRLALVEHWIGGARRTVALIVGSAIAAVGSAAVALLKATIGG